MKEIRRRYQGGIDEVTVGKKIEERLSKEGCELLHTNTEADWLETRMGGLGGSDIASVVGHSEYSTKIDVYISKAARNDVRLKHEYEEKQRKIQESPAVKMGHILEPIVAHLFQEAHPEYYVADHQVTVRGEEWEIANVDRYLLDDTGKLGILECKTTTQYNKDKWEGETVPDNYFIQVQWYLGITGLDFAFISCLIGGQTYREFKIERCDETIAFLRSEGAKFWQESVLPNVIPEPCGHSSYTERLQRIAKDMEDRGEAIEIEQPEENRLRYREVTLELKELKKEQERIKQNVFKEAIEREAKRGTWGDMKFSIRNSSAGNSYIKLN